MLLHSARLCVARRCLPGSPARNHLAEAFSISSPSRTAITVWHCIRTATCGAPSYRSQQHATRPSPVQTSTRTRSVASGRNRSGRSTLPRLRMGQPRSTRLPTSRAPRRWRRAHSGVLSITHLGAMVLTEDHSDEPLLCTTIPASPTAYV